MSKRLLRVLGVVAGIGAVAATAFGVGAWAAAPRVTDPVSGPYHVCVNRETHNVTKIFGKHAEQSCPAGDLLFLWDVKGPKGDRGPRGPKGEPGDPATLSVTAVTAVSNWPEGGAPLHTTEWADDNFSRMLALTREHAAESSKCGGTPQCWFYTGTIADNGTSTTIDGNATPNSRFGGTIDGAFTVTMVGGAHVEFYASSDAPDGALVPATADGSDEPATTSTWYRLAFPEGTTFAGGSLTEYSWTYSSTCEQWIDSINPGDDGQGADDGNISHACPL